MSIFIVITYLLSLLLVAVFIIIATPLPQFVKRAVLKGTKFLAKNKILLFVLLTLDVGLLVQSVNEMCATQNQKRNMAGEVDIATRSRIYAKMFKAQRNFYLSVLNVVMFLVDYRVSKMVNYLINSDKN